MSLYASILEVKNRFGKPTPPFFRKLGNLGLALAGIGAAILSAPVALPAVVTTIAGYLLTAGVAITSVSEVTVDTISAAD
ncbi:hypothetical protein ACFSKL_10155 [Belliella marina]|uniref:Holin n=1 Tax=Belliella marina TaxID=1644146 RepID=A0ABW4VMY6_9BACT